LRDAAAHNPIVRPCTEPRHDRHPAEGFDRRSRARASDCLGAVDGHGQDRACRDDEPPGADLAVAVRLAHAHGQHENVGRGVRFGTAPDQAFGIDPRSDAIVPLKDDEPRGRLCVWLRLGERVGTEPKRICLREAARQRGADDGQHDGAGTESPRTYGLAFMRSPGPS